MGCLFGRALRPLRIERDFGRISRNSRSTDYTDRRRECCTAHPQPKECAACGSAFRMALITADPDDNKFVDCAFAAGADYLVSEDSHFNELRSVPFPKLNLVTLDEFMQTRIISSQE